MQRAFITTVLLAAACSSAKSPVDRLASERPDSMVVIVRMTSDEPLIGARVELETPHLSDRESVARATDASGRAVLPIPPDSGWLRVRAFGFVPSRFLVRGTPTRPTIVRLERDVARLSHICTHSSDPAISLVLEATSPPDSAVVTMRVEDGSYREERLARLRGAPQQFEFAFERAGTYVITASAPGYEVWRRTDVRAVKGACHVSRQVFRVQLVRRQMGR